LKELKIFLQDEIFFFYSGSILSLNQPKEGIYQCIGRNLYGTAQASTALIFPNNVKSEGKTFFFKNFCSLIFIL
jgi:hypothetical protein